MKILFLLGKGGVGKSTVSALLGLHLAHKGKKVVLSSLDPAHNLGDIFGKKLSDSETEIEKGLKVIEADQQKWLKKYLSAAEQQIKKSYSYLTTFSLEKNFSVMQHAPALEEYAMHMAFDHIIKKYKDEDFLIFDMPPTALSLKFFALPQISLIWLNSLAGLRNEIFEKQKIISRLKLGEQHIETDRVKQNLTEQAGGWSLTDSLLKDDKKTIALIVENPDDLSQAESKRIEEKLHSFAVYNHHTILNRADNADLAAKYILTVNDNINTKQIKQPSSAGEIDFTRFYKILDFLD